MTAFLGPGYLAEAGRVLGGLDPVGSVDVTLEYVVSGAPDGKLTVTVVVEGGRVASVEAAKATDPDVTVSLAYDEALAIVSGETTADASYMRGGVKVEGDHATWLLDLRDLRAAAIDALGDLLD